MKHKVFSAILCVALIIHGAGGVVFAKRTAVAGRVSSSLIIDGSLSELAWKTVEPLIIDEALASVLTNSGTFVAAGAPVTGPDDASLRMYFTWDDEYLYIGMDVTDDQIVTDRIVGELAQQDSVEIVLDPEGTGQQRIPLIFAPQTRTGSGPWFSLPGAQIAVAIRSGGVVGKVRTLGYSAEIAIPREAFIRAYGIDLQPGVTFGLEVRLNDVDVIQSVNSAGEIQVTRQWTLLTWTGTKPVLDWQIIPEYGTLLIQE